MKKMDKVKNRVVYIATISSIAVGFIIILIGMSYYKYRISELQINDQADYTEYKYHYALISEKADEPFWDAIYQGAQETGKKQNIYVEKIGIKSPADYSLNDLMKIAIASKVDGIILEPSSNDSIKKLLNEADNAQIPVVTVIKDIPLSKRKSFIGINSYNQGQAYGNQVLELVNAGKHKITVLLNSDNSDTQQSVIYSSIIQEVKNRDVEVKSAIVNTHSTFSSEEAIRNIIMDTENPPDVLVCLTAVDTLCAYQAIVDYNKVGQIDILGYYDSDIILQAIQKKIIRSTMTIDAQKMGAYCVKALSEYRKTKRVSDYYSVNISVINFENVDEYLLKNSRDVTE